MRDMLIGMIAGGVGLATVTTAAQADCTANVSNRPLASVVSNMEAALTKAATNLAPPNSCTTFTITLDAGPYDFSKNVDSNYHLASIDLSRINTVGNQRLLITGATNQGNPATVIITPTQIPNPDNASSSWKPVGAGGTATPGANGSLGANVSHIEFRNLIFTFVETGTPTSATVALANVVPDTGLTDALSRRNAALNTILVDALSTAGQSVTLGATQGILGTTQPDTTGGGIWVSFTTQQNFPLLSDQFDSSSDGQRYLRLYDNSQPLLPSLADTISVYPDTYDIGYGAPTGSLTNAQVPWGSTDQAEVPSYNGSKVYPCSSTIGPCAIKIVVDGATRYIIPPYTPTEKSPNQTIIFVPSSGVPALQSLLTLQTLAGPNGVIGVKNGPGWNSASYFSGSGGTLTTPGAQDITFSNVAWYANARSVFEDGASQIRIINSIIPRPPGIRSLTNTVPGKPGQSVLTAGNPVIQTPALSVAVGGMQIGGEPINPNQPPPIIVGTHSNYIDGYVAQNTGDDSLAFFDDDNDPSATPTITACSQMVTQNCISTVVNTTIINSFARSILLQNIHFPTASNVNVSAPDPMSSINVVGVAPQVSVGLPITTDLLPTGTNETVLGPKTIWTQAAGLSAHGNTIITGNGNTNGCQAFSNDFKSSLTYPLLQPQSPAYVPSLLCGVFYYNTSAK